MGKHEHFKVKGFWNFLLEAEIHAVPNTWEKWIPIIREKYGKKQTFQSFSNILGEEICENTNISKLSVSEMFRLMQKSMQFPKYGKSWFPLYMKSMKKYKHFKFMGFLSILSEAEIHTIPKIWKRWIPIVREKYGKAQTW